MPFLSSIAPKSTRGGKKLPIGSILRNVVGCQGKTARDVQAKWRGEHLLVLRSLLSSVSHDHLAPQHTHLALERKLASCLRCELDGDNFTFRQLS